MAGCLEVCIQHGICMSCLDIARTDRSAPHRPVRRSKDGLRAGVQDAHTSILRNPMQDACQHGGPRQSNIHMCVRAGGRAGPQQDAAVVGARCSYTKGPEDQHVGKPREAQIPRAPPPPPRGQACGPRLGSPVLS
eukprot:366329-Chlamydomonas_euryale.AAC.1